jgi:hypothetical protein
LVFGIQYRVEPIGQIVRRPQVVASKSARGGRIWFYRRSSPGGDVPTPVARSVSAACRKEIPMHSAHDQEFDHRSMAHRDRERHEPVTHQEERVGRDMSDQMTARSTLRPPRGLIVGICRSASGEGKLLEGEKTYKLHIPPNAPAELHWSITLYDTMPRSILETGVRATRFLTLRDAVANTDGSYDLYFGPTPIAGKERNFIQTTPGKGWFLLFRLYGAREAYFDGTWRPDDMVEIGTSTAMSTSMSITTNTVGGRALPLKPY